MNLTFPYCHSLSFYDSILSSALSHDRSIVLDYFGGSGTTAHAIINDNRSRQHSNQYIMIEMGNISTTS